MLESIYIPFFAIFLTELLDKSQLALFLLATRTKNHVQLFLGAMLAFLIVDGIAILAGSFITTVIPEPVLKLLVGGIFIVFGLFTFFQKEKDSEEKTVSVKNAFFTSFGVIFLSEWGDKTQLTAALLATQQNPFSVLLGIMGAFGILSLLAIYAGKFLGKNINRSVLNSIAGIIFLLLGLVFFFS